VALRVANGSVSCLLSSPATLRPVLNPLRSEAEAFRFLLYVVAVVATITVVVVVLRAIL
jgi:hypothetical protein